MKPSSYLFAIVIVSLVFTSIFFVFESNPILLAERTLATPPAATSTTPAPSTPSTETVPTPQPPTVMIEVTSPLPYASATSPLVITGAARGPWYFEGSFPVTLRDAAGVVLAQGVATASGEWMTENMVPFTATLVFATTTATSGTLILSKDNPSGLPEHDASTTIPLLF